MVSNAMRQLEERHMANKIELIVWSNKMDLLALSNSKGEVSLHRLNWQKAWSLPPPAEDILVKGIAWRPDGKVIAIGYNNGDVILVNVENKDIIQVKSNQNDAVQITLLVWIEDMETFSSAASNIDSASVFLPKLPPIARTFGSLSEESNEEFEDIKLVQEQSSLNFLLVGTSDGAVSINVFGLLPCGTLQLPENIRSDSKLISADMSEDLNYIYIIVEHEEMYKLIIYNTCIISTYRKEIHFLAYKHGMLMSLMDYLENTMNAISEAYENMLLLEMESKLTKYAEVNLNGSVSSDFLELLVFGIISEELETFLLKELQEKGIKKLGHSIELSHCNIQKLIMKHVQAVCTNIVYHLSEFRGMSRLTDCYQILGVDECAVTKAYKETGAFLVKANEVQLVIDTSLKKYKAFFKWIHNVIVNLPNDSGMMRIMSMNPPSHYQGTPQEITCIAEYLYSLDMKNSGQNIKQYCLDQVGQYLQDKELQEPLSADNNAWENLIKNSRLSQNETIITRDEKLSLVQQFNRLQGVMGELVMGPGEAIGNKMSIEWSGDIGPVDSNTRVSTIVNDGLTVAYSFNNNLHLVCINTTSFTDRDEPSIKHFSAYFGSGISALRLIDLQFYLESTLSLLLEEPTEERGAVFLQLAVSTIQGSSSVDVCSIVEPGSLRHIENMVGAQLVVSGARKVAVIVSENRHKVRTYEMEVEEDEEEEEEEMDQTPHLSSTNTSLDQSIE